MAELSYKGKYNRVLSIDRFKGFLVFCMVFFICAGEFPVLGIISRIANNSQSGAIKIMEGFTVADLLVPAFLFVIGLTYQSSFERRYVKNKLQAYMHFIIRYMCFIGLGSILVSVENWLVKGIADEFLFTRIFMFIVLGLTIVFVIINFIKAIPQKVKKIIKLLLIGSIIILAIFTLIMAIYDDVILFFFDGWNNCHEHWSILCQIGLTGLISLCYVRLKLPVKCIVWVVLSAIYGSAHYLIPNGILLFDFIVLGGAVGTIGWSLVMLGSMILIEMFNNKHYVAYGITTAIYGIIGITTLCLLPVNTSAVTINYLTFSLFLAGIVLVIFSIFDKFEFKFDLFMWWGRNPIILFGIGIILRGIEIVWSPKDVGLIIALIATFGSTALLTTIAYLLYKKNKIIKL